MRKTRLVRLFGLGAMAALVLAALAVTAGAQAPAGKAGVTLNVSGTVTARGGSGSQAWTMPLKGATVAVADYSASTTTSSSGAYALQVVVPSGPYTGVAIRASHKNYKAQSKALGSANPQVVDFTLAVKGTTIKVLVKHNGRGLKKASVFFRGVKRVTNENGRVTFTNVGLKPNTKYKMTIKKAGYKTKKFNVTSRPGKTRNVTKSI